MSDAKHENPIRLKPRRRRLGRLLIILPVLLALLHFGWGRLEQQKLAKTVEQLRRGGEPMLPEEFDVPAIPDADNGAIDLRAAAASIDEERFKSLDDLQPELPLTEHEASVIRTALADFSNAAPSVESAMAKTGIDWKLQRRTPVMLAPLPDLKSQRRLAKLLAAEVLLAHDAGDDARAIRRAGQVLFISRSVDQQPSLISHLVANGIAALAADRIVQIAPTLKIARIVGQSSAPGDGSRPADADQVKVLIATCLEQDAGNAGLVRAMRGERMMQLDVATAFADGKTDFSQVNRASGGQPPDESTSTSLKLTGYALKPMFLGDGLLSIRYMSGVVAAAAAPNLPAARQQLPAFPSKVREYRQLHLLASIMLLSPDRSFIQHFKFRTDMTLAATSLAIRQYALDHNGSFPVQLTDLVPGYLLAVPLDPMTAGKPLGYINGELPGSSRAGDPIIYSVGENGIDEGGSGQPLPKMSAGETDRWATHDAVVHLTQQPRTPEVDDSTSPFAQPPESRPTTPPFDKLTTAPGE